MKNLKGQAKYSLQIDKVRHHVVINITEPIKKMKKKINGERFNYATRLSGYSIASYDTCIYDNSL